MIAAAPRRADWRSRLADYVEVARRRPFAWGRHDCALFAAGAVQAMTGVDPAEEFRGAYEDEASGFAAVRAAGWAGPLDLVRATWPRVPPAMAQVGDLAVIDVEAGPALGVVQGAHVFLVGRRGLMVADLLAARLAFRV